MSVHCTFDLTSSMEHLPDNTLASFRSFSEEEIAFGGDCRIALSEITFPTNLNNFTDKEFTYFRASEAVASKTNAGNRNKIPRPYRTHFYRSSFL